MMIAIDCCWLQSLKHCSTAAKAKVHNYSNGSWTSIKTICLLTSMAMRFTGESWLEAISSMPDRDRCTARLLLSAASEPGDLSEELLTRLCGIFKSGTLAARFKSPLLTVASGTFDSAASEQRSANFGTPSSGVQVVREEQLQYCYKVSEFVAGQICHRSVALLRSGKAPLSCFSCQVTDEFF